MGESENSENIGPSGLSGRGMGPPF